MIPCLRMAASETFRRREIQNVRNHCGLYGINGSKYREKNNFIGNKRREPGRGREPGNIQGSVVRKNVGENLRFFQAGFFLRSFFGKREECVLRKIFGPRVFGFPQRRPRQEKPALRGTARCDADRAFCADDFPVSVQFHEPRYCGKLFLQPDVRPDRSDGVPASGSGVRPVPVLCIDEPAR